jgi:hypothetical protein
MQNSNSGGGYPTRSDVLQYIASRGPVLRADIAQGLASTQGRHRAYARIVERVNRHVAELRRSQAIKYDFVSGGWVAA